MLNPTQINWQKVDNLLPVIIQNAATCEVLMLGYMNQEALEKTLAEKRVTFFRGPKIVCGPKGKARGIF